MASSAHIYLLTARGEDREIYSNFSESVHKNVMIFMIFVQASPLELRNDD